MNISKKVYSNKLFFFMYFRNHNFLEDSTNEEPIPFILMFKIFFMVLRFFKNN